MKKTSLRKDMFRDIKGSPGRFISIVAIIALGVAFFAGLKIAPEDMEFTADKYYDDYNFMDLRIVSNLGLTEDDVKEIQKIDGVESVRGAYTIDALAEDGDKEIVLRVHDFIEEDQINSARLIKGRFPQSQDECVIEVENENQLQVDIGSKIKLSSGKEEKLEENLKNTQFTVVGFIQSPNYLSFEKGSTNIGNGQLKDYIMIPADNFKLDVFTDIFVNVEGAKTLNTYDDEYFDKIKPVENKIKEIAKGREKNRYDEIYSEAREELDDGRKEYEEEKEKVQKELDKAFQEIEDGNKELEDGERELKDNEDKFYGAISDAKKEIAEAEEKLKDGEVQYKKGLKQFNESKSIAQKEFEKAEKELKVAEEGIGTLKENINKIENILKNPQLPQEQKNELEKQLKDLQSTLSNTEAKYKEGRGQLEKARKELKVAEEGIGTLKESINKIKMAISNPDLAQEEKKELEKQLEDSQAALYSTQAQYKAGREELKTAEEELTAAEEGIGTLKENINKIESTLKNPQLPQEQKKELEQQLQALKSTLSQTESQYRAGKEELEKNKKELIKAEEKLKNSKIQLDDSKNRLRNEKEKLTSEEEKGERELQNARNEIGEARIDLEEGEKEYREEKQKAEEELDKALAKIEKGERDLKKLEKTKWYILNRNKNYSYVDYGSAADRIDAIGKVFPVFFALVAALVSLTTMTRMVDEQRINIGTLKALGYGKKDIAFKYIFYAFTATIIGSIIGISVGYTLFPLIIFNAYGLMYALPPVALIFNFKLAALVTLAAVALTTVTSYLASSNELKENPASLMRPKAPRLGKMILLEKFPIIWDRFNFSYKVTVRNLFRYKRRFFMTVFGIAGCTALILAGFGIRDSIQTVVDQQFGQIISYDMSVNLDSEGLKALDKESNIEEYKLVLSEGGQISFKGTDKDITIIVPNDSKDLDRFIKLKNRKNAKDIDIDDGVVITEGMSRTLNLKKGDTIELTNSDDKKVQVKIQAIAENYTFNYLYINSQQYRDLYDEPIEYNQALAVLKDNSKGEEEKTAKTLIENEGINNVNFVSSNRINLEDTIKGLNYVVILMTVSAGALAFVVLYNLTNINISERIREIATIKVLGFYDSEVSAYIYRENILLTIIGTATGLIIGIFLHKFIIETVEMESLMLGLTLSIKSYIYASVLTIVFAVIVNIVMHFKLKSVKMVESLKSVD